jgi:hypothetical protein
MGTGVGEAMLIGAAVGGGSSALMGGDPIKGAMIGAAGGGLGAGFGAASAVPGATTGAATTGAATGASSGIGIGAGTGASGATFGSIGAGTGSGFGISAGVAPGAVSGAGTGAVSGAGTGAGSSILAGSANPALYGMAPGTTGGISGGAGIGAGSSMVSPNTMSLANQGASTPFSIRDLFSKMPTPDVTGSPEAQKQVAQATGKNILGYMPGEEGFISDARLGAIGAGSAILGKKDSNVPGAEGYKNSFDISKFKTSNPIYAPESVYVPSYKDYRTAAEGGIMKLAAGGMVDPMQKMPNGGLASIQGQRDGYAPMTTMDGNIPQFDEGGITGILESMKDQGLSPEMYENIYGRGNKIIAMQKALKEGKMVNGMASGGISSLGSYSDGGRMLKGPGDGMSDSIPGVIAGKQPARLAEGEFVVPADVVSHLGNGSTDAGAKQLYSMMDRVRKARTGNKKQGKQIKPAKYMAA